MKVTDVLIRFFNNKQWWDHVTVKPDDNKIIVFNNGTVKGLIVLVHIGGQEQPISTQGKSLLWKNAWKSKEKQISLIINKIKFIHIYIYIYMYIYECVYITYIVYYLCVKVVKIKKGYGCMIFACIKSQKMIDFCFLKITKYW